MVGNKGLQMCLIRANIFWAFSFHLRQDTATLSPTRSIHQVNKGTRCCTTRQLKYPSHYQHSSITCGSGPSHFFNVQRYPKQAPGVTSDILILSLKLILVLLQLDPLTSSSPLGEGYFWNEIKRRVSLQAFKSIFPRGNFSRIINPIQHRKLTRWALEILSQPLSPCFLNMKKKLSRFCSTLSFKVSTEIPLMNTVLQNFFHLKSFLLLTNTFQILL